MIHSPDSPRPSPAPRREEGGSHAVPPPFADPEPAGADPAFDRGNRRWLSALNLLAVFTVGTGAGIAAAWWSIDQPAQVVLQAAPAPQSPSAPAQPSTTEAPAAASPLPSDELPYDGVALDGKDSFVPRIPYRIESMPENAGTSGGGEASKVPAADGPKGQASDRDAKAKEAKAAADESEPKKAEAAEKPEPVKGAGATAEAKSAKPEHKTPVKAVARPKREPGVPRRAARTDGEIQRILQQATDELWRKRVRERMPDEGSAGHWANPPWFSTVSQG